MKVVLRPEFYAVQPVKVEEVRNIITPEGQTPLYIPNDRVHVSSPIRFYRIELEGLKAGEKSKMKGKYVMAWSSRVFEANTAFATIKLMEKDAIIAEVELDKDKYTITDII